MNHAHLYYFNVVHLWIVGVWPTCMKLHDVQVLNVPEALPTEKEWPFCNFRIRAWLKALQVCANYVNVGQTLFHNLFVVVNCHLTNRCVVWWGFLTTQTSESDAPITRSLSLLWTVAITNCALYCQTVDKHFVFHKLHSEYLGSYCSVNWLYITGVHTLLLIMQT